MLRSAIPRLSPVRRPPATAPASINTSSGRSSNIPDLGSNQPATSSFFSTASRATRCFATSNSVASSEKQAPQVDTESSRSSPAHEHGNGIQQGSGQVSISYRGTTVLAQAGTKLRTAMLRGGISPHNGRAQVINCRGLGTCGTCAVEVQTGQVQPLEWSGAEKLRLNFPPHSAPNNQRLRLACQVSCESDLEVAKYDGFWGQGSIPRGRIESGEIMQAPLLGELEYIMDAKERRQSTRKLD